MRTLLFLLSLIVASPASAADVTSGPVIADYGKVAEVETTMPLPADVALRHAFDVTEGAKAGEVNRGFDSAARFVNMHARAGVPTDRIQAAIVVHGPAVLDLLNAQAYAKRRDGKDNANANAPLVAALIAHNVRVIVCGQSAAAQDVANADLLPGVEVALSAMTAHALLQQQGYTLNPF